MHVVAVAVVPMVVRVARGIHCTPSQQPHKENLAPL